MKQITEQQRDTAFEQASEQIQRVYHSPELGKLLRTTATEHSVKDDHYHTFAISIGDTMLQLLTSEELESVLAQQTSLTQPQARAAINQIASAFPDINITPLEEQTPIESAPEQKPQQAFAPKGVEMTTPTALTSTPLLKKEVVLPAQEAPKPAGEEKKLESAQPLRAPIPGVRTMRADIDRLRQSAPADATKEKQPAATSHTGKLPTSKEQ